MRFNTLLIIDVINECANMGLDINIKNKQGQMKLKMSID